MAQGVMMQHVEIRVEGHLDQTWAKWLDGFTLTHTGQGETVLTGEVKDQAALYGLIAKLRDLGVKLVSVNSGSRKRP
jgi:hypothetical protein